MTILLSRGGNNTIAQQVEDVIRVSKPKTLCVASAYLTQNGAMFLDKLVSKYKVQEARIIAGLSGQITHPNAITTLKERSWDVRFGLEQRGIFHPKLLVGCDHFSPSKGLVNPNGFYIGSGNFTASGLRVNTEIGYTSCDLNKAREAALAFRDLWDCSDKYSAQALADYEAKFSQKIQTRSAEDLITLGIVDELTKIPSKKIQSMPVLNAASATTVWVGLESFTGEYNFQVEFPAKVSAALNSILKTHQIDSTASKISVECADSISREMTYSYYPDNGMTRLNVPNDVPLVTWARQNRKGALVLSLIAGSILHAEIVRQAKLDEVRSRSFALGTWGKTSTRYYGWY